MQRRQHAQHRVDIGIGAAGKFGRHGMRAQEGGAHATACACPSARATRRHLRFGSSARP
jgi:hypothetical protein